MSARDEWYSPEWLVRMCEKAMGIERFDVDMYSCEEAQKVVQAREYYTKDNPFPPGAVWPSGTTAFCNAPGSMLAEAWTNMNENFYNWCWVGFSWAGVHRILRQINVYEPGPLSRPLLLLPSRIHFTPGPGLKRSSPSADMYMSFSRIGHAVRFAYMYFEQFGKRVTVL